MNFSQMNIDKQLKTVLFFLVVIIGLMSAFTIWQASELSQQTQTLYDHPLQVRRALDNIKIDQQKMSVAIRTMEVSETEIERTEAYNRLVLYKSQIPMYMSELQALYLGPIEDIAGIIASYSVWEDQLDRSANLLLTGEAEAARIALKPGGEYDRLTKELQSALNIVDDFAKNKADDLYAASEFRRRVITISNFVLFALFLLLIYWISKRTYRSLQDPLHDLVRVVKAVESGNLSERSMIATRNEFGELAIGLNGMLDSIENSDELNRKSASLSEIMLGEDDMEAFFQSLLSGLLTSVNGQLGGVYLQAEDKETYDLFVSVGMGKGKRTSFDRTSLEGELGLAASSREIQVLKELDESTPFRYSVSAGELMPKEIITVPILNQDELIALISLASVNGFDDLTTVLLENERTVMSTRIQSVLDQQQRKIIKDRLEMQNIELEAQKAELDDLSLELRKQNQELEQQKTELSEANRLKTHFLSNMSHELRTPLNSVIALSGVLERRLKDRVTEEEHQYLTVIGRSGKNLLEMINDILDISRIEAGREELELESFDMEALLDEELSIIRPLSEEKGIALNKRMVGEDRRMISDPKKIRHILQNLISNAVKFTDEGSVEIRAERNAAGMKLQVIDTGIGISGHDQVSIFEEFQQVDGSTTRRYGGTGLGLAIAKRYTEFLGGEIAVESAVGEGSRFTVVLPELQLDDSAAKKAWHQPVQEAEKASVSSPRKTQGEHLLIVEDSDPAIVQLKDVFGEEGYRISVARDGAEALEMIQRDKPDGIILDLMMPKVDGFQVLKTIREDQATTRIPVLVLSAKHITKEELSLLKHNRIFQLIQKGNINLEALKNSVADMIHPPAIETDSISAMVKNRVSKPVVMVVEDNEDNRLTARAVLGDHFYVIEAEDGEQAVKMAAEHVPDLILMDNALPGIDGVEAFRRIRASQSLAHIPILALTASAMISDREIFLEYGFDGFVAKPIIEDELLDAIKGVLYGEY